MTSLLKALALRKGGTKHTKLCEEWGEVREPVLDGVTFYVKYIGSSLVQEPKGKRATADAIKTTISMAKASNRKLERVAFTVTSSGIRVVNQASQDVHLEVSIYRISYCSADAAHNHVFAFIATNKNETYECHAFLCPKRKMAQAAALTIAQAFDIAFECWQKGQGSIPFSESKKSVLNGCHRNGNGIKLDKSNEDEDNLIMDGLPSQDCELLTSPHVSKQGVLIDLTDNLNCEMTSNSQWGFDDDFQCDEMFEKFTLTRFQHEIDDNSSNSTTAKINGQKVDDYCSNHIENSFLKEIATP